jgi:hypothetical protein
MSTRCIGCDPIEAGSGILRRIEIRAAEVDVALRPEARRGGWIAPKLRPRMRHGSGPSGDPFRLRGEGLGRGRVAEALGRPAVGPRTEFRERVIGQVRDRGFGRRPPADAAVRVLDRALLMRGLRIAEPDVDPGRVRRLAPGRELPPPVEGDRTPGVLGQGAERPGQSTRHAA